MRPYRSGLFQQRVQEWQPDGCLGCNPFHYHVLREMRLKVPGDLGWAEMYIEIF